MLIHFRVTMNTCLGIGSVAVSKQRAGADKIQPGIIGPEVIPKQEPLT